MDSKGRNVIVCDNGTGVRIETIFFSILKDKKMDAFVQMKCMGWAIAVISQQTTILTPIRRRLKHKML